MLPVAFAAQECGFSPRGSGAEKNENYALQWYSLAALSIVLWIVLSFRRDAPTA